MHEPPFEPYRIRVVEPLRLTSRDERAELIRAAGHNPFLLRADDVLIDLVTDSGTSALSVRQLQGLVGSDESFTGSRSSRRFLEAARELFGHRHVIPCHQGRAAEHLLACALLQPGHVVLANTLFATTRANFEAAGAICRDLPVPAALDPRDDHPFKGDIDLAALERALEGPGEVPFVVLTVTDNSRGGQPVSLANLRAASQLCHARGVAVLLDGARCAENAYLLTLREPELAGVTPREVARRMFALVDGVFMSLKKDGLGNTGGLITLERDDWAAAVREQVLASEGLLGAGGLAGRDLELLATSFTEMLDADLLAWRVATTRRMHAQLEEAGVPVMRPHGAHAVSIDGRAFCPHLGDEDLPAWSLSVALYVASGVRGWETGNVMRGRYDRAAGTWSWPDLDLLRLAIPRRVYTRSHLDYVMREVVELHRRRERVPGLRFDGPPPKLPQFVARFVPA